MRFTDSHEWIRIEADIGTVGITEIAQDELGEIVYIELPSVGKQVKAGQEVAVLESTKAAADIYTPVTGEIVEINQKLLDFVQYINRSAEQEGWLFKIKITQPKELDALLNRDQYLEIVNPKNVKKDS